MAYREYETSVTCPKDKSYGTAGARPFGSTTTGRRLTPWIKLTGVIDTVSYEYPATTLQNRGMCGFVVSGYESGYSVSPRGVCRGCGPVDRGDGILFGACQQRAYPIGIGNGVTRLPSSRLRNEFVFILAGAARESVDDRFRSEGVCH